MYNSNALTHAHQVHPDPYECGYVAVYGTLRSGYWNHGLLRAAVSHGVHTLKGYKLYVMSNITYDTIPFIVESDDADAEVTVEMFSEGEVPWVDQVEHLDWLENHPDWYTRVAVTVNEQACWVYVFKGKVAEQYLSGDDIQQVPTGDWCNPVAKEDMIDASPIK